MYQFLLVLSHGVYRCLECFPTRVEAERSAVRALDIIGEGHFRLEFVVI